MDNRMKKFWLVTEQIAGQMTETVFCMTEDAAINDAMDRAKRYPGRKFFVFESIGLAEKRDTSFDRL